MMATLARRTPNIWVSASKIISANSAGKFSTSACQFSSHDPNLEIGPWPRTQRERELAAKKYNLIPEDYIPFDEAEQLGDYPNLKAIGGFNRTPYDDYDDMYLPRFFGEVLHIDADMYHYERIDPLKEEKYQPFDSKEQWVIMFLIPIAVISVVMGCRIFGITINTPHKNRNFDPPGTKYYKFASSGNDHHHH